MRTAFGHILPALLRIYVAAALLVAALLAPASLSFAPVLTLIWYLVQWRWRISAFIDVMTKYFMFFAIALFFTPVFGPWLGVAVGLPVLPVLNRALEDFTTTVIIRDGKAGRSFSRLYVTILVIALALFVVGTLLGNLVLILADTVIIAYFVASGLYVLKNVPVQPVTVTRVQCRIVAGKTEHLKVDLHSNTRAGGKLFIASADDWVRVNPTILPLDHRDYVLELSVTPPLSGPLVIILECRVVDRRGLLEARFQLEAVKLVVIPRARYAAWLARKYISGTNPGALPIIADITAIKPRFGLRQGVEYYGNQSYQPGDSLKNIDWKRSLKYNELISKEFTEFRGQPAVVLVNLVASDAEAADTLAYNIIITAISLAQEAIPAALAVYNSQTVVATTHKLHAAEIVLRALQVVKEITTCPDPTRYLNPPDIGRLRANLSRLCLVEGHPASALAGLLRAEYRSLGDNARSNPCTRALNEVRTGASEQSAVVVISQRNHDAEALAFNSFAVTRSGGAFISI